MGPGQMGPGGSFDRFSGRGRRGGRSGRFEGFLRRMDTNGDGIIQQNEIPEERRGMVQMMSMRFGIDPAQGISIDKVREAIGSRGSGGNRATPPTQNSTTNQNRSAQKAKPEEPPLVPGFGSDREPTEVAGFGVRIRPTGRVVLGAEGDVTPQIRALFGRLDGNGNGVLDRDEWTVLPGNPGQFDANQDGRITLAELSARMTQQPSEQSQRDRGRRDWGGGPPMGFGGSPMGFDMGFGAADEDEDEPAPKEETRRGSYRFRSARERLPTGLPGWFADRDVDLDGQVSMAEFAGNWTRSTVQEYFRYDANRDGVITPEECLHPGSGAAGGNTVGPQPAKPSSESSEKPLSGGSPKPWYLRW